MDENIKTYQRSILAHREAGRKGGRPKKTDENQKVFDDNQTEPIGFFEKPNETKRPLKYKVQQILKYLIVVALKRCPLPPKASFHRRMLKR